MLILLYCYGVVISGAVIAPYTIEAVPMDPTFIVRSLSVKNPEKLIYKSAKRIQSINLPYHSCHMGGVDLFGQFVYNVFAGAGIIGSLPSSLHKRRAMNFPALLQAIINSFR